MNESKIARRTWLKTALGGTLAAPLVTLAARVEAAATPAAAPPAPAPAAAQALVALKPDEPTAKALGYVDDTTKVDNKANPTHKPEQFCAACVQFKGKPTDTRAGCNIFPGKSVSSHGWCKVFAAKPKT